MTKKQNVNEKWAKPLAEILRKEFKKRKTQNKEFTQEMFADELNIGETTLTLLLKEQRNPSLDTAFSIAEALNCSIDYLVGLSPVKEREWNDIAKSSVLIQQEIGLSKHSLDKLLNMKKASKTEFVDTINELICSHSQIVNKIRDYLQYQPDFENEVIPYDGGRRKEMENNIPELLEYGLKGTVSKIQYDYLDVEDINNSRIEKIKKELPHFKDDSYISYLKNKERLEYYQYLLEEAKTDLDFGKLSDEEYTKLDSEYSGMIDEYSIKIKRYEISYGGLINGKE